MIGSIVMTRPSVSRAYRNFKAGFPRCLPVALTLLRRRQLQLHTARLILHHLLRQLDEAGGTCKRVGAAVRQDGESCCKSGPITASGVCLGGVDPGESVKPGAPREVWEETGLRVRVVRLVGVYADPRNYTLDNWAPFVQCWRGSSPSRRAFPCDIISPDLFGLRPSPFKVTRYSTL
jgi:hypothetical protein